MRSKHTNCVQKMMILTEQKFVNFYNEMKAVMATCVLHHTRYLHGLNEDTTMLERCLNGFDHEARSLAVIHALQLNQRELLKANEDHHQEEDHQEEDHQEEDHSSPSPHLFLHQTVPTAVKDGVEAIEVSRALHQLFTMVHAANVVYCK